MTDNADLAMAVARVEVRLEAMQSSTDARLVDIQQDVSATYKQAKETNGRVSSLEAWRDRSKGAIAAFALLGPVITGVVTALIITQFT